MKVVEKYTSEVIQDLLLRACKRKNNLEQVEKLYKRFYYNDINYQTLASIMISLYQCRISKQLVITDILDDLSPHKICMWQDVNTIDNNSYYKQVVMTLVRNIAITEVYNIKEYKIPAYWRNYERYDKDSLPT